MQYQLLALQCMRVLAYNIAGACIATQAILDMHISIALKLYHTSYLSTPMHVKLQCMF